MKLSKAQQAVVDKMREGWQLIENDFWWWCTYTKIEAADVKRSTINKMVELGIIEIVPKSILFSHTEYRLTEKWKQ